MADTTDRPLTLRAWSRLTEDEQQAVRQLEIAEEQLDFAGATASAVDLAAMSDERRLVGVAIIAETADVVGFFLLKRSSEAPDWVPDDAAVISALRIDRRWQGQGLGSRAMRLVPDWVRAAWPETTRVVLAVDEPNAGAIAAYTKAGWTDDGVRVRGRIGWERRMTHWL